MEPLTDRETTLLVIAEQYSSSEQGTQEAAVWRIMKCSMTTYAQMLNRLLDDERAISRYPLLVNRLRRIRDDRMERKGR